MAEQEDVRIETAEDREWERVRDAVKAAEVDLSETREEFLARTERQLRFERECKEPHFEFVDE